VLFLIFAAAAASTWFVAGTDLVGKFFNDNDPDLPAFAANIDRKEYFLRRIEQMDLLRGYDTATQESRTNSIIDMERAEQALRAQNRGSGQPEPASWVPIGPAPLPVPGGITNSGRVSAIAIHPTNPDIAYVGTAQGGLYRTLNGGATWTPLMDRALTLAIGAVAIAPSDPSTVYVGTGESTLCGSGCYIGVGLYRITSADTDPVLSPVLNKNLAGADVFTGRAISEVLVHPTDPNTVFVATTQGVAGIGGTVSGLTPLPAIGLYRTTNGMADNATFERIPVMSVNTALTDLVMVPGDANKVYVAASGVGVFATNNALDAAPTFTQLLTTGDRIELAANRAGDVTTVYAASGQSSGSVFKSVDGAPFALTVSNGFCGQQCFYDIALAVDPNDASTVYLGGWTPLIFGRSTNGGMSFASSASGLHVDTHVIAVAPSNPQIVYFGSDGGIWRTLNVSATPVVWNSLNNTTFSATQFMSLALHPTDRNYMIGGTQDNGTEFLAPDGVSWVRSDGGDGGFSVIDQTSLNTTDVVAYHTYFNQTGSQIGFARATTTVPPGDPNWTGFLGCGGTPNGINCGDGVLFYAPMAGGPSVEGSIGNTLYFGTNRLYRSTNQGTTMTDVSGSLGLSARVSAIAISPQDDNIRLVGTSGGSVFVQSTPGATNMRNITAGLPGRYVGRVAIDPTNANVAYVCVNGFGVAAGRHVMKTTNLLDTGTVVWTPAGNGIPDTPVNSFAIDPQNTNILYAGADIGVFRSMDGGANWEPFSNGLPRVAVYGIAIQNNHRILRIATHGRGIWDYNLAADHTVSDFDGDARSDLAVFRESTGLWYIRNSSNQVDSAPGWGTVGDVITPGDYDGDGKTDLAVYRPSAGTWYVYQSTAGITQAQFGIESDLPVQGDYDGDGRADLAVFRPSDGVWYVQRSTAGFIGTQFGQAGDKPVQGDYDGDGKTDLAVYRPGTGVWYILQSRDGFTAAQFGADTDKVVPGDFDGDGKTDLAVYRDGAEAYWYIQGSSSGFTFRQWGTTGDIPSPGDFDGDGQTDLSVFRPSSGIWYRIDSGNGAPFSSQYGASGDKPVASGYVPVQ
jgi:hypothetical protein